MATTVCLHVLKILYVYLCRNADLGPDKTLARAPALPALQPPTPANVPSSWSSNVACTRVECPHKALSTSQQHSPSLQHGMLSKKDGAPPTSPCTPCLGNEGPGTDKTHVSTTVHRQSCIGRVACEKRGPVRLWKARDKGPWSGNWQTRETGSSGTV